MAAEHFPQHFCKIVHDFFDVAQDSKILETCKFYSNFIRVTPGRRRPAAKGVPKV